MGRFAFKARFILLIHGWSGQLLRSHPESMILRLTQEGYEFGVVRTMTGELWQVNNSGTRWHHSLLDSGPVGAEFELKMDANGVANIAYLALEKRLVR